MTFLYEQLNFYPAQVTKQTHIGSSVTDIATTGSFTLISASKEVILSAGTIGTPNILLHSGVGDENQLTRLGISSVLNLPDVGKNLTDQAVLSVNWATTSQNPLDG